MASLRSKLFLPLAVAVSTVACGDDPMTPNPGGNNNDTREVLAQPSFATNINEIFQRRGCTSGSCHGAPGGQNGLMLSTSAAANYGMLVNVPSTWQGAPDRVIPNDADGSFLVIKLEGRQGTRGGRMPLNGAQLDNIDLTNIKNWIDNGAPNN